MNSPYTLQRWSSIAHSGHGAELLPAPLSSDAFARALSALATGETRELAFLVIKVLADSKVAFQRPSERRTRRRSNRDFVSR